MINHRVDRVVDVIQSVESVLHRFSRRDLAERIKPASWVAGNCTT